MICNHGRQTALQPSGSIYESADSIEFPSTMSTTYESKGWIARMLAPSPPEDDSTLARLKFIGQQLDCFGPGHRLDSRYELLGPDHRQYGGMLLYALLLPLGVRFV
jgi:hypothetical protein